MVTYIFYVLHRTQSLQQQRQLRLIPVAPPACLRAHPQYKHKSQAQVSLAGPLPSGADLTCVVSVAGCVSCDDCTHVNLQHNQAETQCIIVACDSRDRRGAEAGPPVVSVAPFPEGGSSVIASLSCPIQPSCPLTPIDAGNSNIKSYNKMQSVNVTFSTNLNKGNDNCLLIECNTAVTVPNTKPQRNTDGPVWALNNNRIKLDLVNVNDKKYGALNRFSMEPQSQCRLNQIPGDDIPSCDDKIHLKKSDYLKTSDFTYNDVDESMMKKQFMTTENDVKDKLPEDYICFDRLIALSKRTENLIRKGLVPSGLLGLYGGGESSLSTGTTGWGTPPGTNSNNNNGKLHYLTVTNYRSLSNLNTITADLDTFIIKNHEISKFRLLYCKLSLNCCQLKHHFKKAHHIELLIHLFIYHLQVVIQQAGVIHQTKEMPIINSNGTIIKIGQIIRIKDLRTYKTRTQIKRTIRIRIFNNRTLNRRHLRRIIRAGDSNRARTLKDPPVLPVATPHRQPLLDNQVDLNSQGHLLLRLNNNLNN